MTSDVRRLIDEVSEQIKMRTATADFETVAKLAKMAATLQGLLEEAGRIEVSLELIEQDFSEFRGNAIASSTPMEVSQSFPNGPLSGPVTADTVPITVVVRWSNERQERIACSTAAATMRELLERALVHLPVEDFEKLSLVRTGRGPLISRSPQTDFVNKVSGGSYTYHQLARSPWFVITHSSTQEKIDHMRAALGIIGLNGSTVNGSPAIAPLKDILGTSETDDGRI